MKLIQRWTTRRHGNGLLRAIVTTLVILVAVVGLAVALVWNRLEPNIDDATYGDFIASVQITLAVIAGLGGAIALVVAYRRQAVSERVELNERFQAASAQLGHENAAVRLAGVYAMTHLADQWHDQRQMCIDVLCAYVRNAGHPPKPDAPKAEQKAWSADNDVRRAILHTIAEHVRGFEASDVSWQGCTFDLTGATIDLELSFAEAEFRDGCTFSLREALFVHCAVSFYKATFRGAPFDPSVDFEGATFDSGHINFIGASFVGGVRFDLAEFTGATVELRTLITQGVSFHRASLVRGTLDFEGARVEDLVVLSMDFKGGRASFRNATFHAGPSTFNEAVFTGSSVTFDGASFHRWWLPAGTEMFSESIFLDGQVDFRNVKRWPGRKALGLPKEAPGLELPHDPDTPFGHTSNDDGSDDDQR